jgi:hypothetical protein
MMLMCADLKNNIKVNGYISSFARYPFHAEESATNKYFTILSFQQKEMVTVKIDSSSVNNLVPSILLFYLFEN